MGYNGVAPQDRATAQILIVMGSLVTLGGIAALIFIDPSVTIRGIPSRLVTPFLALGGVWMLWRGVNMWRKDGSSEPPTTQSQTGGRGSGRVTRVIPVIYFALVAGVGGLLVLGGIATLITGIVVADRNVVSTGVLLLVGGFALGLIGGAAGMYFKNAHDADRE